MDGIQKHLSYFPRHLREALERFSRWESVCEIRLRDGLPLSLTAFDLTWCIYFNKIRIWLIYIKETVDTDYMCCNSVFHRYL